MNLSLSLKSLLDELKQLYRKISLDHWRIRMDRYHKETSHSADSHDSCIKSSLMEYINNVVVAEKHEDETPKFNHSGNRVITPNKHVSESHQTITIYPFRSEAKHDGPNPFTLTEQQAEQLSKHFKPNNKWAVSHPGIKEKLSKSIWEHISASIQCAHRGNNDNAKMHADIANNAFKEVAHYMPEKEYSTLSKKINERLDALKVDNKSVSVH